MIRLNCRKVVLETLFCIGCKSAKMFVMGFLGEFSSWSTKLYYKKPYPLTLFLAKVLKKMKGYLSYATELIKKSFYSRMANDTQYE